MRVTDDYILEGDGTFTSLSGTDNEIYEVFGEDTRIVETITNKDSTKNGEEALLEVYRKLRPGEPPTVESAVTHLKNLFFDDRRYDLSKVGRYKYNKKLGIALRLCGQTLSQPIVNELTGEVMAEAGQVVKRDLAWEIEKAGVDTAYVTVEDREVKIMSNGMVDITDFIKIDTEEIGIHEKVRFCVLKQILDSSANNDEIIEQVKNRIDELIPKHITKDDIFASINYINNLAYGIGHVPRQY